MTADNPTPPADPQNPPANPALKNLSLLVGQWNVELIFPADPANKIHGQVTFEWLEGGAFVIERLGNSLWIIGPDDSTETYTTLYHDERSVSRVYQMSLSGGVWKLWRNSPGFSQRFEGKFNAEANTITAYWDISNDGSTWERDFDVTYTKVR